MLLLVFCVSIYFAIWNSIFLSTIKVKIKKRREIIKDLRRYYVPPSTKRLIAAIIGGLVFLFFIKNVVAAIFVGLVVQEMYKTGYSIVKSPELRKYKEQIRTAIELFGDSLRTEASAVKALQRVASVIEEPLKNDLEECLSLVAGGVAVYESIEHLGKQKRLPELVVFSRLVRAVEQNKLELFDSFTSLAELLHNKEKMVTMRLAEAAQQRVLTYILNALPILIFLGVYMFSASGHEFFGKTFIGFLLTAYLFGSLYGKIMFFNKLTSTADIEA